MGSLTPKSLEYHFSFCETMTYMYTISTTHLSRGIGWFGHRVALSVSQKSYFRSGTVVIASIVLILVSIVLVVRDSISTT